MDESRFDRLSLFLSYAGARRGIVLLLAIALPGAAVALGAEANNAARRRPHQRRARFHDSLQEERKRRKRACAKSGQTTSKKRKKCCEGLAKGESGLCSPLSPPLSPCKPSTCPANRCDAVPDGCGGTLNCACASNNICVDGGCQPCDVCAAGCFFASVQGAINAAAPGEAVRVCPGLYPGDLTIGQNLTLIGAGDGLGAGNTILQGLGTTSVVQINDGVSVTLQNLRITGGSTPGNGGGINNFANALVLIDCTINGNRATGTLGGGGGGIYSESGTSLQLSGCNVSGNSTDVTTAKYGGGIYFNGIDLIITNSAIAGNTSKFGGGIGLFNNGTVTLDAASRVTGNHADPGIPDSGGGIVNGTGTVTLSSAANVSGNDPDNCSGPIPLCVD